MKIYTVAVLHVLFYVPNKIFLSRSVITDFLLKIELFNPFFKVDEKCI